jgi:hypothetical protein
MKNSIFLARAYREWLNEKTSRLVKSFLENQGKLKLILGLIPAEARADGRFEILNVYSIKSGW